MASIAGAAVVDLVDRFVARASAPSDDWRDSADLEELNRRVLAAIRRAADRRIDRILASVDRETAQSQGSEADPDQR